MFFTLLNFYILRSLYPLRLFMEFCQFVVVGCSGFKFFCFCFHGILLVCGCRLQVALDLSFFFLADLHIFFFFVVKSMAKKNHEIFLITFSFPFFSVCNFYWIFGFLGFFYLVLIRGLFQLIYSVFLIFILHWFGFSFSLFLVMQFLLDFCFLGFFYLISILGLFWFDIQCYCRLHLH